MGDHVVLSVDRLMTLSTTEPEKSKDLEPPQASGVKISTSRQQLSGSSDSSEVSILSKEDEREPLMQVIECRICQEEDHIKNLETPCACSGSLKYAHRKCVQRWCNEKGDVTCEICHQAYKPGYTAPPPRPVSDDTIIDISGGWAISGRPLDLRDPRLLAMAAAERRFVEAEYDDASTNASGAAFCRSAALILLALLLLRHTLSISNDDGEKDDALAIFSANLFDSSSQFPPPMLHYGLGHQCFTKAKTATGDSGFGCSRCCIYATCRPAYRTTVCSSSCSSSCASFSSFSCTNCPSRSTLKAFVASYPRLS